MGRAKHRELVGASSLLARVTAALGRAETVTIVGDATGAVRADATVREDPPGGGPVAGLAAGLVHVSSPVVVVAAADLPFLTAAAVDELRQGLGQDGGADVAIAVDGDGRDQLLLAAWSRTALGASIARLSLVRGARMSALYDGADVRRVRLTGDPPPWWDCDTPQDLATARIWATQETPR
jgi:molybdopterin-guanine dinucleotide biosynthesis protein A